MIDPLLICILIAAFGAGRVSKGMFQKKRIMPPSGSALQKQPEAYWPVWKPEFGKVLGGKR